MSPDWRGRGLHGALQVVHERATGSASNTADSFPPVSVPCGRNPSASSGQPPAILVAMNMSLMLPPLATGEDVHSRVGDEENLVDGEAGSRVEATSDCDTALCHYGTFVNISSAAMTVRGLSN